MLNPSSLPGFKASFPSQLLLASTDTPDLCYSSPLLLPLYHLLLSSTLESSSSCLLISMPNHEITGRKHLCESRENKKEGPGIGGRNTFCPSHSSSRKVEGRGLRKSVILGMFYLGVDDTQNLGAIMLRCPPAHENHRS